MDTIPSAEFRKRYASLRVPTIVTVNGHTIGTWTPATNHATIPTVEPVSRAGFGTSRPAPKPKR
jgi:hypothetical protein